MIREKFDFYFVEGRTKVSQTTMLKNFPVKVSICYVCAIVLKQGKVCRVVWIVGVAVTNIYIEIAHYRGFEK